MEPVSTSLASTSTVPRAKRRPRHWTPEEDQILFEHYGGPGASFEALAERLERSPESIRMRAIRLGLASRTARGWTPEQDQILRDSYDSDSATISRLATRLKRARMAVVRRAAKLGLQRARTRDWTEDEDRILRETYDSNPATTRKLARMLGRKRDAVSRRASKLGLARDPGRPWQKREDDLLERFAARNTPVPDIARALRRTEGAVLGRMRKIGVDRQTYAFRVSELAAILGTGQGRVRRWIERGMLVAQRTSDAEGAHHRVTYRELKKFFLRYLHEVNFQDLEQRGAKETFVDILLDGQAGQLGAEGFGRGIEDPGALA